MTSLHNVKVQYIRPHFNNLKEWCEYPDNCYIGRKGIVFITDEFGNKERYPKHDSIWANPFKVSPTKYSLEESLELYRAYIINKIKNENLNIEQLRHKKLGCWCVKSPIQFSHHIYMNECCHGQILMQLLHDNSGELFFV